MDLQRRHDRRSASLGDNQGEFLLALWTMRSKSSGLGALYFHDMLTIRALNSHGPSS